MNDMQFKEFMVEQKKQTELLNRILEESETANSKLAEYFEDIYRETREIKVRLIEALTKLN